MRLEFEPNVSAMPLVENEIFEDVGFSNSPGFDVLLNRGIAAAQNGERDTARTLLTHAAEIEPRSEDAWMWLASISDYPEELLAFLNNVLSINPNNSRASEWLAATKSLIAKTFVQRAAVAHEQGNAELVSQFLDQAIDHDQDCELAWFWKASVAADEDQKLAHLERVLTINPDNADAHSAISELKRHRSEQLFNNARSAAGAGDGTKAIELVDELLACTTDNAEAWILKSHLSGEIGEKIFALGKALEIDPDNVGARSGYDFLTTTVGSYKTVPADSEVESLDATTNDEGLESASAADSDADHDETVPVEEMSVDAETGEASEFVAPTEDHGHDSDESQRVVNMFARMDNDNDDDEVQARAEQETEESLPVAHLAADTDFYADHYDNAAPSAAVELYSVEDAPVSEADAYSVDESQASSFVSDTAHETPAPTTDFYNVADVPPASPFDSYVDEAPATPPVESAHVEDDVPTESLDRNSVDDAPAQSFDPYNVDDAPTASFNSHNAHEAHVDSSDPYSVVDAPTAGFNSHDVEDAPTPSFDSFNHEVADTSDMPTEEPVAAVSEQEADLSPVKAPGSAFDCPFCAAVNDSQAFECASCRATLTLSDIETLLSKQGADRDIMLQAVSGMEAEWNFRDLSEAELTTLGIAHFNLQNFEAGFKRLQEASSLNPNNVILAGQVNTIAIRLDEMRRQNEVRDSMPKGKTILVVDDSPTVRKLISGKLEKSGHIVVCASDGVEALERLGEKLPDLVLLDITMPRMDGYEVCKHIRANAAAKDLPVVMISGKDGFFDKVRGRMAGTTGYVTKPFGPETLMKALEMYLLPENEQVN